MWDHLGNWETLAQFSPLLAVWVASLLGSGHCVAMCGPLITRLPQRTYLYHLGRLLAYLTLGALAGLLGEALVPWRWINLAATVALVIFFVLSAWRIFRRQREITLMPAFLSKRLAAPLTAAMNAAQKHPLGVFALGVMTSLIPCGWLHTFLAAAVATGSPLRGALTLFAFWAGTVPALALGLAFFTRVFSPLGKRYPVAVAVLLLIAAAGTVTIRVLPSHTASSHHNCH